MFKGWCSVPSGRKYFRVRHNGGANSTNNSRNTLFENPLGLNYITTGMVFCGILFGCTRAFRRIAFATLATARIAKRNPRKKHTAQKYHKHRANRYPEMPCFSCVSHHAVILHCAGVSRQARYNSPFDQYPPLIFFH